MTHTSETPRDIQCMLRQTQPVPATAQTATTADTPEVLAQYQAGDAVRYQLSGRAYAHPEDEFADVHIEHLQVVSRTVNGMQATLKAWRVLSLGAAGTVDRLYQAATDIDSGLADAIASIRAWEPSIVGDDDTGPIMVLAGVDPQDGPDEITRGLIATLSQAAHDRPERLATRRLVVSVDETMPFCREDHMSEMRQLTKRLGIDVQHYVPWQPPGPDQQSLAAPEIFSPDYGN